MLKQWCICVPVGINLNLVNDLIDGITVISNEHKEFLKKIIKLRKEIIIDKNIL